MRDHASLGGPVQGVAEEETRSAGRDGPPMMSPDAAGRRSVWFALAPSTLSDAAVRRAMLRIRCVARHLSQWSDFFNMMALLTARLRTAVMSAALQFRPSSFCGVAS